MNETTRPVRFRRLLVPNANSGACAIFVAIALAAFGLQSTIGLQRTFSQELDPRFAKEKFSINGLVRFQNLEQAEARRQQLVRSIWTEGLPLSRPVVTDVPKDAPEFASIDGSLFVSAQRWDVDVSRFDFHSLSFVLFPTARPSGDAFKLAIVHAGHMPEGATHYLEAGLARSAEELLRAGSIVALMQMPLAGWNRDADGRIGDSPFQLTKRLTAGHDELFNATEPILKAGAMRFFLEPVVQVTNELLARAPKERTLVMIGLSGGGWTTHMSAALDPRIDVSIPVAGAYPLYARPFSRGSKGDAEQEYAALFREVDSDGDGILDRADGTASWLEVFLLGAISPSKDRPRKQIQVLNFFDSCCFHGPIYETYSHALTSLAKQINESQWEIFIDRSHHSHLISDEVIQQVVRR